MESTESKEYVITMPAGNKGIYKDFRDKLRTAINLTYRSGGRKHSGTVSTDDKSGTFTVHSDNLSQGDLEVIIGQIKKNKKLEKARASNPLKRAYKSLTITTRPEGKDAASTAGITAAGALETYTQGTSQEAFQETSQETSQGISLSQEYEALYVESDDNRKRAETALAELHGKHDALTKDYAAALATLEATKASLARLQEDAERKGEGIRTLESRLATYESPGVASTPVERTFFTDDISRANAISAHYQKLSHALIALGVVKPAKAGRMPAWQKHPTQSEADLERYAREGLDVIPAFERSEEYLANKDDFDLVSEAEMLRKEHPHLRIEVPSGVAAKVTGIRESYESRRAVALASLKGINEELPRGFTILIDEFSVQKGSANYRIILPIPARRHDALYGGFERDLLAYVRKVASTVGGKENAPRKVSVASHNFLDHTVSSVVVMQKKGLDLGKLQKALFYGQAETTFHQLGLRMDVAIYSTTAGSPLYRQEGQKAVAAPPRLPAKPKGKEGVRTGNVKTIDADVEMVADAYLDLIKGKKEYVGILTLSKELFRRLGGHPGRHVLAGALASLVKNGLVEKKGRSVRQV